MSLLGHHLRHILRPLSAAFAFLLLLFCPRLMGFGIFFLDMADILWALLDDMHMVTASLQLHILDRLTILFVYFGLWLGIDGTRIDTNPSLFSHILLGTHQRESLF
jgi:hypothetical protein